MNESCLSVLPAFMRIDHYQILAEMIKALFAEPILHPKCRTNCGLLNESLTDTYPVKMWRKFDCIGDGITMTGQQRHSESATRIVRSSFPCGKYSLKKYIVFQMSGFQ